MTHVARNALHAVVADRYHLTAVVGHGSSGSVYRARDRVLGRDVAVKVFRAELSEPADLARQAQEVRMLSSMSHPNLVAVFDAGQHWFGPEVRRYVVMELVDDTSLYARLELGPMPAHEVAAIGAQLADVLAYLHERGIVHRDIKPANVLISDMGSLGFLRTARLTDFGIATYVGATRLTSEGMIMGTASYLSPEQVAGEPVGTQSDVYSLGLVLLESLTGQREYDGTVVEAAVSRLTRDPVVPETIAPEWRDLLTAMTRRFPADRPTASEVAARLRGSRLSGSGHVHERLGRTSLVVAGVLGAVAILGLGILIGALLV